MSLTLQPGERVVVEEFGPGSVVAPTRIGALVILDEMAGLQLEFPLAQLCRVSGELPEAECAPGRVEQLGAASSALPVRGGRERQDLEALRFGLVPASCLAPLTLGFEDLQQWVISGLPVNHAGKPLVSCICGPFGTGKSHTMAVVRHVARSQGYLTASVDVDGTSISLSNPEPLLYQLWSSLSGPDFQTPTPVLDLYVKAIDAGHSAPRIGRYGDDRVRQNYQVVQSVRRQGFLDQHGDALDGILSSSPEFTASQVSAMLRKEAKLTTAESAVKRMVGARASDRPRDFVEALVGHTLVGTLAGFRGLVITIDEFEVEQSFLTPKTYARVEKLLETLAGYMAGKMKLQAAPLAVFLATVGEQQEQSILRHLVEHTQGNFYPLQPWHRDSLQDLGARINRVYQEAYALSDEIEEEVLATTLADLSTEHLEDESGLIRAFIKRHLGVLDSHYGPGPT